MSSEVLDHLGLSCNGTGSFHVCHDKPSKFMGCCSIDPCKRDDGLCPDDDLQGSTYDKYIHKEILPQTCQSDKEDVQWYTCAEVDPPFMGCCSVMPCADGCPDDKLFAAKLSDEPDEADVFLPSEVRSTATASATNDSDDGDGGLSKGAVGGIAAGASVAGLLLIGALVFFFLRRRKQKQHAHAPVSTYDPSYGAPTIVGSEGPGSPLQKGEHPHFSPVTTPFSPQDQQMAQYNMPNTPGSPQYWHQQQHNPHVSMQSMSTHQGLGMSPSPFNGSQTSPVPSQGPFRDSMQTAYVSNDGSHQQHFVQELPASQEYVGAGGNNGGGNHFAAEMEAPDHRQK